MFSEGWVCTLYTIISFWDFLTFTVFLHTLCSLILIRVADFGCFIQKSVNQPFLNSTLAKVDKDQLISKYLFTSRMSNIAFLMDWAQMSDLGFGLIHRNITIKKAPFHHQECPLSWKSGKLWSNSYIFRIRITSNWLYSQQFSLPYFMIILSVCLFKGDKKKKKKVLVNLSEFFH